MPYFVSPKILFGKGILKRLDAEIKGRGKKALLMTDKNMAPQSAQLAEVIQGAGYEVMVWDQAEQEPSIDGAAAGKEALVRFQPQMVTAFGGGSVIDTAKAAWILYARPDIEVQQIGKEVSPKSRLNLREKAFFLAVPTTSGTGSECTWAVVLTDKAKNRKIAFANNEIVPDLALLAPEFTVGMPPGLTASTGMDVLGHAFDGFTARQQTDFSDGLCLQAMKMAFSWLPKAVKDGGDMVAREKMQNAAAIAGMGFGNSNTSLSHALAHSLGVTFHISHGRSVGLALIYSLDYITANPHFENTPDPKEKLASSARFVGINNASDQEAIKNLIQKIKFLMEEIGEPLSLKEAGVSPNQFEANLDDLVTRASKDVNMYSTPCECQGEKLKDLFCRMWVGY